MQFIMDFLQKKNKPMILTFELIFVHLMILSKYMIFNALFLSFSNILRTGALSYLNNSVVQ